MGIPFVEQLRGLGWNHIEGDIDVPYLLQPNQSYEDPCLHDFIVRH